MGRKLNRQEFNSLLEELKKDYRIFGPKKFEGIGTYSETDILRYGEISKLEDLVHNEKTDFSQKEVYFPITQTLMNFVNGEIIEAEDKESKGLILFLRPCDINSLRSLDKVFLGNGHMKDPYYEKLRGKLRLFMLECKEGFDSCFCVSMGSNIAENYDCGLRFSGDDVFVQLGEKNGNDDFRDLLSSMIEKTGEASSFEVEFIKENKKKVKLPKIEKVTMEMFDSELWSEYTKRCIACGRCNFVCPTCSCWTMQDAMYDKKGENGERRRVWGSCHVDGYTDMAGGHSFRRANGERMRFKVFHKVYDFKKRFGENMCVGCGRCDDICPEYISYSNSINKLTELTEKEEEKGNE